MAKLFAVLITMANFSSYRKKFKYQKAKNE